MSRIEILRRILSHLDTCWDKGEDCTHPDTNIVVADSEYDDMVRELQTLSPNEPRFVNMTSDSKVEYSGDKVIHDPPMTSISKASHEDLQKQKQMLFKWMNDCEKNIPSDEKRYVIPEEQYEGNDFSYSNSMFFQCYKLDGVALAIYYENGKLVKAGLRPRDGINGLDVTNGVKYVKGIPEELPEPLTCSIRGEIICKWTDFEKVQKELADAGKKLRANPRNHAAGAIQNEDPKDVKKARLSFIAYGIEGLDNPKYKTEIERAKYSNKVLKVPYIQVRPLNFYQLEELEKNKSELDYMVDGIIVGVDNLEDYEQLGRHGDPRTGNPKGKIAWKFREEIATPVVKEIIYQTGRTGQITPVAIFDPVRLAETDVRRATLHNIGFVIRQGIVVGTKIKVVKAGAIIPKVIGVVEGEGDPDLPNQCPSCNAKTELIQGGLLDKENEIYSYEICCTGKECPAQMISKFQHYFATFGVLGLGESRIEQLVLELGIKKFSQFYELTIDDCMKTGLTERQSLLVVANIHMVKNPEKQKDNDKLLKAIQKAQSNKKEIPASKLFACFGIRAAGKSAGKALIEHFQNFNNIVNATAEQLVEVDDIGETTAEEIIDWFNKNRSQIQELLNHVEPTAPKIGKLTGQIFCLSGSLEGGKKKWQDAIENLGGKCSGSVGKKTSYLVTGEGSGSKTDKAKELGVEIITVQELEKLL